MGYFTLERFDIWGNRSLGYPHVGSQTPAPGGDRLGSITLSRTEDGKITGCFRSQASEPHGTSCEPSAKFGAAVKF